MIVWASLPHGFDWPQHAPPHIYTFDFSQRGCSFLPFRSGAGGIRRVLLREDGASVRFEWDDNVTVWDELRPLRDGSLFHVVSFLSQSAGSEIVG